MRRAAVCALLAVLAGCAGHSKLVVIKEPGPLDGLRRVASLRVGVPDQRRWNLLFTCDAPASSPRIGSVAYSRDSLDTIGERWLRVPAPLIDTASAMAPDTLVVRAFAEATDEEIAFERGELDAAVFWPGELSARMRSDARFRSPEMSLRPRGLLACIAAPGDTLAPPEVDLSTLNREAFGGDLLPWSALEPATGAGAPARYDVDRTIPGAKLIERVLARVASPGAQRTLKLVYMDQPLAGADAAQAAWRGPGVMPLLALRLPVLVRSQSVAGIRTIGVDAIAGLAPCASGSRR